MKFIVQINTGDVSEEELAARREKAMADPQIQNILTDPVMRQVRLHVRNWLTLQWVGHCRCLTYTWLLKAQLHSSLPCSATPVLYVISRPAQVVGAATSVK
jgi:hypothetical protein